MERHEQACQSAAEKILQDMPLPSSLAEMRKLLANAFDRGSCFGVKNFDAIRLGIGGPKG
jgi:hypothetical protein